VSILSFIYFC